jgi:hypothetical protein
VKEASADLPAGRPSVSIGHDLYWWRHDDTGLRTAVSVYWPAGWQFERLLAVLQWYDSSGRLVVEHDVWLKAIPDAEAFRVDGDHDACVSNAKQFVPTLIRACRSVVERSR